MPNQKKVIIIGGGFSSLSASCYLAKLGYDVLVLEKNNQLGGRARQLKKDGFTFDIGPTFYWMPDVFETFFNNFGKSASDYYELDKLNPAYQVYYEGGESISLPDNIEDIKILFESIEEGSALKLQEFISNAEDNYRIAIQDLVYKPGENLFEIINFQTFKKLNLFFKSIQQSVAEHFSDPRLIKIMEFPTLFLGAKPSKTPAFYNFMNYADFCLGTWHPKGGMYKVVDAMIKLATELGVKFECNTTVNAIVTSGKKVTHIDTSSGIKECDILLSGADYVHTESLLDRENRQYTASYWEKKTLAPSALLFYVGFCKKLDNVSHHTLFFDTDFTEHAKSIYDTPEWPNEPLFYASFPSITDSSVAPSGNENGIFLIPIAPGIEDSEALRAKYFDLIISRMESLTDQSIKDSILFKESFGINNFIEDYNSFKGNAYGLANTLFQTHVLRPKLKSKKVENLYFTGQLTVPGPGVPPSIISGKIVAELIKKYE